MSDVQAAVNEIARACARVIGDGLEYVSITVGGPPPRGERVRLIRSYRKKQPMGVVLNWQDDPPRTVAQFKAMEVLAFFAAQGLVEVREGNQRTQSEDGDG